jgi:hypothetical protein
MYRITASCPATPARLDRVGRSSNGCRAPSPEICIWWSSAALLPRQGAVSPLHHVPWRCVSDIAESVGFDRVMRVAFEFTCSPLLGDRFMLEGSADRIATVSASYASFWVQVSSQSG